MKTTGLALVLILLFAAPVSTGAQKTTKVWRIGTLSAFSAPSQPDWQQRSPFWGALREMGWIEGQNLVVERRWAEGRLDRLPALAVELVQLAPDLIWLHSTPAAVAVKQATTAIPVVIAVASSVLSLTLLYNA